jgi:hypothetical protein
MDASHTRLAQVKGDRQSPATRERWRAVLQTEVAPRRRPRRIESV